MSNSPKRRQLLAYAVQHGLFRAADVAHLDVSPSYLDYLANEGVIEKTARGLYRAATHVTTENHGLVEIATLVPDCVICLLSALQFHEIGTQLPPAIWIALPNFSKVPKLPMRIEVVRMNKIGLTEGIDTHILESKPVKIFNPAKTIADCFKFRRHVGLDVALEALKVSLNRRIASPSEIHRYAVIDQVSSVIEPYLEALSV